MNIDKRDDNPMGMIEGTTVAVDPIQFEGAMKSHEGGWKCNEDGREWAIHSVRQAMAEAMAIKVGVHGELLVKQGYRFIPYEKAA